MRIRVVSVQLCDHQTLLLLVTLPEEYYGYYGYRVTPDPATVVLFCEYQSVAVPRDGSGSGKTHRLIVGGGGGLVQDIPNISSFLTILLVSLVKHYNSHFTPIIVFF